MSCTLTLYFYPSPHGVDWASPRSLARSVLLNQLSFAGHPIGHVQIGLESPGTRRFATGMVQISMPEQRKKIIQEGLGLGTLFRDFPGRIETTDAIYPEIQGRFSRGNISYLKFLVSPAAHARALTYAREYVERGYSAHYGLPNRPLYGEGAGCSAFAASFLEVTGLLDPEFFSAWSRTICVPEKWIGGVDRKVSLLGLLDPRGSSSWATESEPHRKIFFWDPDLMHSWALRVWSSDERPFGREKTKNACGLILDRRDAVVPQGTVWKV